MKRVIGALLALVGIVNLLPLAGLLSPQLLASAYGIGPPRGDLLILLQHRALLFGVLGGIILASVFRSHLQPTAVAAGFVSMMGFVFLAVAHGDFGPEIRSVVIVDVLASVALGTVVVLRRRSGSGSEVAEASRSVFEQ